MEKRIRDQGFHVRLAEEQDIKRLLAVYYQQDVTTDCFEDYDGERWAREIPAIAQRLAIERDILPSAD